MIKQSDIAAELYKRRQARKSLQDYISYVNKSFVHSRFSTAVCQALDKFIVDCQNGFRPVLILQAPPQMGKSEMASRQLPAYLLGKFPDWRIAAASYSSTLADSMSLDVRRNLVSPEHLALFPEPEEKRKYSINRNGEFSSPNGKGGYIGDGVGGGFTGRAADIFIIDDPIKNAQEALSPTVKEGHWNWYQSTCKTRMSANSGQIIMATSWAEDDLSARIIDLHRGDPRLTVLKFPAINDPGEVGYNPDLPLGPLVPELHPLEQLLELKAESSDYWWSAMFQQSPKSLGGNIFKESSIKYYLPKDLPTKFDKVIASWDCTFKDTDGTDFVVGQVWGKKGADSYLLDQIRARLSFTDTVLSVILLRDRWKATREILIEDKANGPAVIDVLKKRVPGIIPIEPDGSKIARAHAVTSFWEAGNIYLPHPDIAPWVKEFISELTAFPAGAHDDQCFVGDTMISTPDGDKPIRDMVVGDSVITPFGIGRVIDCGPNRIKNVINKNGLTGTASHKIFTQNGFKPLDALTQADSCDILSLRRLIRWRILKLLNSMESSTDSWEGRDGIILASQRQMREGSVLRASMSQFGNFIMEGQLRKALKFIISMVILSTTTLKTYAKYRVKNIVRLSREHTILNILPKYDHSLSHGINPKRAEHGTENMQKPKRKMLFVPAYGAVKNLLQRIKMRVTVLLCVGTKPEGQKDSIMLPGNANNAGQNMTQFCQLTRLVSKSSVLKSAQIETVYNLKVESDGVYYANGILVSNCDAMTQALRRLYPTFSGLNISQAAINKMLCRG
jgi:predicted phage terminase large subunit-like protein